ncbi:MAG: aminotransferase class IV [Gemmatimonadales bacterium]
MGQTVYLNGEFLDKKDAHLSPDDRGFLFADGVYEVIRAYRGRFFAAGPHLERLANGLAALRIEGVDAPGLETVSYELLERNGLSGADATVYVQVTRGAAPRIHAFPPEPVEPTVYLDAGPFSSKADPAEGIAAITRPDLRWARCDIKSVSLLPNCLAAQEARDAGAQEAVLVRDSVALEGTHTSFFAVVDGVVRTAPKTNYILPSITRQTLLELCREHDIPFEESPVFDSELARAEELFVAGTTFEVMPIVEMNGRTVGRGKPGPVAMRLLELFRDRAIG